MSVGAGFRMEKSAHAHINKIYAGAHKHVGASYTHIKKAGKAGIKTQKAKTSGIVKQLHKEAGAGFKKAMASAHEGMKKDLSKAKGAGTKVGAGVKKANKKKKLK